MQNAVDRQLLEVSIGETGTQLPAGGKGDDIGREPEPGER